MATPGSLAEAQEMYALHVAAVKAILQGQSYTIGNRTLTRANLVSVTRELKEWRQRMRALSGGSMRIRRALIRDV